MTDVFISYKREDQPTAERLKSALQQEGWQVWWDQEIYAGEKWGDKLFEELGKAKTVVVLWSPRALTSKWVVKEAEFAREGGKYVPAMIESCKVPSTFAEIEMAELGGWRGAQSEELNILFKGIARHVMPSRIDTVRPGYDTRFLGPKIGLPAVRGRAREFKYLHFSVVLNPARSMAWYAAYNMDRPDPADRSRRALRWMDDPLLPQEFQPVHDQFRGSKWDRGHLVSPASVAWGDQRSSSIAKRQANYWTNVAPQHEHLNRHWWLQLERWERGIVKARGKATGFTGPVFSEDDPVDREIVVSRGRLEATELARVPRCYWKLVLARDGDEGLHLGAFCLDQFQLIERNARKIDLDEHRITVADLEKLTGLTFCNSIHDAAPLS